MNSEIFYQTEVSSSKQDSTKNEGNSLDDMIIKGIAAIIFILPWLFTPLTFEYYEIIKNTFLLVGVLILVFLATLKIFIDKKWTFKRTPLDIPIAVLGISFILSTIFSISRDSSIWGYKSRFTGGILSFIGLILIYYLCVNILTKKKQVLTLIKVLTASVVLLALFVILRALGIFNTIFEGLAKNGTRYTFLLNPVFSPIGNPNSLPYLFLSMIPIVLTSIKDNSESIWIKILSVVNACLLLFAIAVTTAIGFNPVTIVIWSIVAIVLIVIFFIYTPFSNTILFSYFPIIVVTIMSMLFSFSSDVRNVVFSKVNFVRYPEIPVETSWSVATGMFEEYKARGFLIGTGPETYAYNFPRYRPVEQNLQANWHQNFTHGSTQLFTLINDLGIIGFVSYCLFALVVVFLAIRILIKRKKRMLPSFALAIASVISLLGTFLSYYPISTQIVLWTILSLVVGLDTIIHKEEYHTLSLSLQLTDSKERTSKNAFGIIMLGISSLLLVTGSILIFRNFQAEISYKQSIDKLEILDLEKANDAIVRAIKKNDQRDYYHIHAAKVALALLKQSTEIEQTEESDAYQLYIVKVINRELEESIDLNPINYSNWEIASIIYKQLVDLTQGKLYGDQTLTSATKAVELNPYNPNNYITLGYVMKYNTNKELQVKAEEVFIQAYRLNPQYPLSIFALGSYWEFVEKYDDAKQLYETSLDLYYTSDSEVSKLLTKRIGMLEKAKNKEEIEYDNYEEDVIQEVEESILEDEGMDSSNVRVYD